MFHGKEYVYAVYKNQSFSKAASQLYISQPSLSATIKKIEDRLGSPIFDRSTNPIQLTECGKQYITYVERILDMEKEFDYYLNQLNELSTGYLSIGGSNFFSSYILPPLLSRFMHTYPQIEVKLVETHTKALEKQLFAGELDLVIDNYQFPTTLYQQHLFCTEELLVAIPAHFEINEHLKEQALPLQTVLNHQHLSDTIPTLSLATLQDVPFVLLRSGNDTRERSDRLFKQAGFVPQVLLKLDQQATAYHVACSGMGATFISDTLLKQVPPDKRLVYYKLAEPDARRHIYFYHKRNKYTTRAMEAFLELACQTPLKPDTIPSTKG